MMETNGKAGNMYEKSDTERANQVCKHKEDNNGVNQKVTVQSSTKQRYS